MEKCCGEWFVVKISMHMHKLCNLFFVFIFACGMHVHTYAYMTCCEVCRTCRTGMLNTGD